MTLPTDLLCNLDDYQHILVTGPDALTFLQGQLTCDMREINEQTASLGAHCNAKGRMVSLFRAFKAGEDFVLRLPGAIGESALAALQKYAVFSKVKLDHPWNWKTLGVAGSTAAGFLESWLQDHGASLPSAVNAISQNEQLMVLAVESQNGSTVTRYEVSGDAELLSAFTKSLQNHCPDLLSGDQTAWHYFDLEAGVPYLTPETAEQFTPHDLNLPALGGVSFNKGCYTGQEIVARMEHLGKLKKQLVVMSFEGEGLEAAGDELVAGQPISVVGEDGKRKPVGTLVNVVWCFGQVVGLGLML